MKASVEVRWFILEELGQRRVEDGRVAREGVYRCVLGQGVRCIVNFLLFAVEDLIDCVADWFIICCSMGISLLLWSIYVMYIFQI